MTIHFWLDHLIYNLNNYINDTFIETVLTIHPGERSRGSYLTSAS